MHLHQGCEHTIYHTVTIYPIRRMLTSYPVILKFFYRIHGNISYDIPSGPIFQCPCQNGFIGALQPLPVPQKQATDAKDCWGDAHMLVDALQLVKEWWREGGRRSCVCACNAPISPHTSARLPTPQPLPHTVHHACIMCLHLVLVCLSVFVFEQSLCACTVRARASLQASWRPAWGSPHSSLLLPLHPDNLFSCNTRPGGTGKAAGTSVGWLLSISVTVQA